MPRRALLLAALLLPGTALARPGFVLGLRLAIAPALLEAADRLPLSELVASQVPVQAEALWRIDPRLAAGAYLSFGLGQPGAAGCGGASCGATSIRAGAELQLEPRTPILGGAPWLGAGAGWEWLEVIRDDAGGEVTTGLHGPEGFVEAGLAWRAGARFAVGPYLLLAAGSYGRASLDAPGGSASAPVPERSVHLWLHVGVRGTFEL